MTRRRSAFAFRQAAALLALLMISSVLFEACGDNTATSTVAATTAAAAQTTAASSAATTAAAGAATTAASSGSATTAAATTAAAGGAATTAAAGATTAAAASGGNSGAVAGATGDGRFKLNKNVSGTIDFWHFWGSPVRRNGVRRVIAICKQQLPNITVRETFKPFGDIWTANTAAVAAGSGMPDVIVEDRAKLPQAAANNIETDLQPLATRDGVDSKAFFPFTWNDTLYNNDTYGIPFETDVRVLFYNKNAFKEVGLDPEKPPKTWADLEQYADKLDKKNADGGYDRIGFSPLLGNGGWDLYGLLNGAQEVTPEGKPVANDPKMVEALTWMKKWVDRYGGLANFQKFRGQFSAAPNDAFMSGKVAMIIDVNGYASQMNFYRPQVPKADNSGKEELLWGVSDIPYNSNGGKQTSTSGGFTLSIPKGSKNVDAAWEFIKCAAGADGMSSWARDTYAMPSNLVAAKDPTLLADPNWQFMLNAMNYSVPIGVKFVKEYANWGEQIDKRTNDVWEGKVTPQQALDQAQQAIDAEIAKNKK
jgi:multiple sugar transport system substrate-binding protein